MKRTALFSQGGRLSAFSVLGLAIALALALAALEQPSFSKTERALATPQASPTPTPYPCQPLPPTCPNPAVVTVNSPQVPCDVCIPANFPGNPIAFFDDYSWRSFIALVWPAQIQNNNRGVPDTSQTVGGTGPRVFETTTRSNSTRLSIRSGLQERTFRRLSPLTSTHWM